MEQHFIQYIKREIVFRFPTDAQSPWFAELQHYKAGFQQPAHHVTRLTGYPAHKVKTGDVIWLVSQLKLKGKLLPPALDGKIVVKEVIQLNNNEQKGGLKFVADKGSCWFPLKDATAVLAAIEVQPKIGYPYKPFASAKATAGQSFQSMKMIHNPDILSDLQQQLEQSPIDFISYRIKDGTHAAFSKTAELLQNGATVFWDRWGLPRRLAERRELVDDAELDTLLCQKIQQSRTVYGIESNLYAVSKSYSAKEKNEAEKLGKYKAVPIKACLATK